MLDLLLFVALFAGLMALRFLAATIIFLALLPAGDRCPNCDAPTMRVSSRFADALIPWFRKRWCLGCGWEGMLRRGPVGEMPGSTPQLSQSP
ncbi:MAG: hypothetical protein MNPFHGCM_00113 [Gemmatimonadaceae bacterium]|nr:hypothetical protein [Gemmatimonadaceae bacterium]